jgi:hypothetical protein
MKEQQRNHLEKGLERELKTGSNAQFVKKVLDLLNGER